MSALSRARENSAYADLGISAICTRIREVVCTSRSTWATGQTLPRRTN
jgi:hypothetical protein